MTDYSDTVVTLHTTVTDQIEAVVTLHIPSFHLSMLGAAMVALSYDFLCYSIVIYSYYIIMININYTNICFIIFTHHPLMVCVHISTFSSAFEQSIGVC